MMNYYPNGYYDFFPFHLFGFIFMILFWIIIFSFIFRFIRGSRNHKRWSEWHSGDKTHPIDILKERYAKGEITKEQFESMKEDLK